MTTTSPAFRLEILAPLSGVLVPLESVPDAVFAQKMVGDGVSIDPTSSELLAPVSGTITQIHEARHALTITTEGGVEVLVHIGVDTVALRGDGFDALVNQGDRVSVGQPLIVFSLDQVACKAKSLMTQIVVPNGQTISSVHLFGRVVTAGKDVLFVIEPNNSDGAPTAASSSTASADAVTSEVIEITNPSGLHARPAAVFAAAARQFQSEVRLLRGVDDVNAKSITALMAISLRKGDQVRLKVIGPDGAQATAKLAALLSSGSGEKIDAAAPASAPAAAKATLRPTEARPGELRGEPASPGLALGKIFHFRRDDIVVPENGGGVDNEMSSLEAALVQAEAQLTSLGVASTSPAEEIAAAHQEILQDPELRTIALTQIRAGRSAGHAWRMAYTAQAAKLETLDNPMMRGRAVDIRDVGLRVLRSIAGISPAALQIPEGSVVIAEELSPSDTACFDAKTVLGLCTVTGGATSHVAILARSAGMPAICGISPELLQLAEGKLVILDGTSGVLKLAPTEEEIRRARAQMSEDAARRARQLAAAADPAITRDGHSVKVFANVRNADEVREAVASGADGVGLLRSEFLFENAATPPTEEEQAAAYLAAAKALGAERTLVIRTLDVGGDKPMKFLPLPREANPFLGMRGIRISLDQPELLRTQLRAILKAAPVAHVHVMFPMIATLEEFRAAAEILRQEMQVAKCTVKIGVMIEVPSAAVLAEALAREADFFSIGTNDLIQYTLAMDRGHAKLARSADGLNPAVLKMIQFAVDGAHRHGKPVAVCGGLAADNAAVPILVGLGVDELSVPPKAVPELKALIKTFSYKDCQKLASEAVNKGTAAEVRALLTPS